MVTNQRKGSIYEKGRQARRFIVKIWTRTKGKKDAGSYENLTEDRDPSVPRDSVPGPSTSASSGVKDQFQDLELHEIRPWDGCVLGDNLKGTTDDLVESSPLQVTGSLMSGFAALGLNSDQLPPSQVTTKGLPTDASLDLNPRTTYFHDNAHKPKEVDFGKTDGSIVLDLSSPGDEQHDINKNTVTSSTTGSGLRFDDKDWRLYYGKKGKKKLRKKVLFQVNKDERTLNKECYVELEEEQDGQKKKKKKRRVMSTKARKRAKRAGVLAWKGLKVSWKYLKNGLIFMTDSPGNALNVSNIAKLYIKPNTEGYDRHSYTTYTSYRSK